MHCSYCLGSAHFQQSFQILDGRNKEENCNVLTKPSNSCPNLKFGLWFSIKHFESYCHVK